MDFLQDWFSHPDYWFQQSDETDNYLTENYQHLLDEPWDTCVSDVYYHLLHLIINDQLVRHVYRKAEAQHIITYHLQKALQIHFHINKYYSIWYSLKPIEWCFWGLPVRHSQNQRWILTLIKLTWKKLKMISYDSNDALLLKRFLTASYQRMPMDQKEMIEYFQPTGAGIFENLYPFISILDYFPIMVKTDIISSLKPCFDNFLQTHRIDTCIISLSGGVDSMVMSYVLSKYCHVKVYALHIHYNNRGDEEAKFVQEWCNYLNIPLYMRTLHEIQRQPCMKYNMRSIYESYTRYVRYECYREVGRLIECEGFPYVFMGHNQDDCFENILTNICHQYKYDNLNGMEKLQEMEGISFCRPMLKIPKKDIYYEAHQIGIPYLKDSTPEWSQRGQIRDNVRPALEEWDNRMVQSMFKLSAILKEAESFKQTILADWIRETKVDDKGIHLSLPLNHNNLCSQSLWKDYLSHHGLNIKMKSLEYYMNKMNECSKKHKTFKCALNKDTLILVEFVDNDCKIMIYNN